MYLHEAIEKIVMRAVEYGFVSHFKRRCLAALVEEFTNADSGQTNTSSYYEQGSMEDLYFGYWCFSVGISIAFISFIGQFLVHFKFQYILCSSLKHFRKKYSIKCKKCLKF